MKARTRKGGTIAETGPALIMFLVFIFFPLLDVVSYVGLYGSAWYYNHLMLNELAVRTFAEGSGGTVHGEVSAKFRHTGICAVFKTGAITDVVAYPGGNPPIVSCVSTLVGEPFIPVPFLGLTKMTVQIAGEEVRENTN